MMKESDNLWFRILNIQLPIIMLISVLILLPSVAMGNMSPKPAEMEFGFIGPDALEVMIALFITNILLNIFILLIPLLIISRFDYDKEVTTLWIWAIPLISIVGAHIDAEVFYFENIPMIAGLFLVAISFFIVVTMLMELSFRTGLIVSLFALFMNLMAWMFIDWPQIVIWALMLFGTVYFLLLILLFIANTNSYIRRDPDYNRKEYFRQAIAFGLTVVIVLFTLVKYGEF